MRKPTIESIVAVSTEVIKVGEPNPNSDSQGDKILEILETGDAFLVVTALSGRYEYSKERISAVRLYPDSG